MMPVAMPATQELKHPLAMTLKRLIGDLLSAESSFHGLLMPRNDWRLLHLWVYLQPGEGADAHFAILPCYSHE